MKYETITFFNGMFTVTKRVPVQEPFHRQVCTNKLVLGKNMVTIPLRDDPLVVPPFALKMGV